LGIGGRYRFGEARRKNEGEQREPRTKAKKGENDSLLKKKNCLGVRNYKSQIGGTGLDMPKRRGGGGFGPWIGIRDQEKGILGSRRRLKGKHSQNTGEKYCHRKNREKKCQKRGGGQRRGRDLALNKRPRKYCYIRKLRWKPASTPGEKLTKGRGGRKEHTLTFMRHWGKDMVLWGLDIDTLGLTKATKPRLKPANENRIFRRRDPCRLGSFESREG